MDPRVNRFKKQLSTLNYSGFDVLSEENFSLTMGETQKTNVSDDKVVETTLVSGSDEKVRLRMRLLKPSTGSDVLLDTTVTVPRNGTFIIGGPRYNGGVLVLPVTATY